MPSDFAFRSHLGSNLELYCLSELGAVLFAMPASTAASCTGATREHSATEEEPVSKEPPTEEEKAKLADEDRVGLGPRFRQTPVGAFRGRHIS